MPMPQRVQYSATIEPLVQFIEDTPPSEILDRTLDKLRAGVPTETMLTASALAVTRYTEMPPGHHGGPLHPLAGLYAVSTTVDRLKGEERFLPVLQHVALTNKGPRLRGRNCPAALSDRLLMEALAHIRGHRDIHHLRIAELEVVHQLGVFVDRLHL